MGVVDVTLDLSGVVSLVSSLLAVILLGFGHRRAAAIAAAAPFAVLATFAAMKSPVAPARVRKRAMRSEKPCRNWVDQAPWFCAAKHPWADPLLVLTYALLWKTGYLWPAVALAIPVSLIDVLPRGLNMSMAFGGGP